MAENLKTTKYRNGDVISSFKGYVPNEVTSSYQWAYNDNEANVPYSGRLYTWYAATDSRNIAPAGWHVPTDEEWSILENYLISNGYNYDGTLTDNKIAKSMASNTNWQRSYSTGSIGNDLTKNNGSGFTALPGGFRITGGSYYGGGQFGYWWSSIESNSSWAWFRELDYDNVRLKLSNNPKTYGYSIRCIKDISNPMNIATSYVPAGAFIMGSPNTEVNHDANEIQHEVTLSAFRMSKYEITNAQYAAFLNAKGIGSNGIYAAGAYPSQPLISASSGSTDWGLHYTNNQWVPVTGYENNPVINVTWYGAMEFATYVGGSLPTEAQWEYACRAGTNTPFNTGDCLTNEQANYNWANPYSNCTNTITTFPGKTQPVGSYPPNAWGLYDMHGNVREWCADWYGTYPTSAQTNPAGPATGSWRVFRGGSWEDSGRYCRSANRNCGYPVFTYYSMGFRVVFVP